MKIERQKLIQAFTEFSQHHGLILGDPGAGKSYTIRYLSDALDADGFTNLYFPLDRIYASSEESLRDALGYKASRFINYLEGASQTGGLLLFDSYDSLRSINQRQFYLNMFREIIFNCPLWSVLVSCRTYDAEKSLELIELFPPIRGEEKPSENQCKTAIKCRHFYIPQLTEQDIREGIDTVAGLSNIYEHATERLKTLFKSPFNIVLIEKIIERDGIKELSAIQSEVQLLELFYKYRVEQRDSIEKKKILKNLVQEMIASKKMMAYVPDGVNADVCHQLCSDGMLIEAGGAQLAFKHNIIFDYVVSLFGIDDSRGIEPFLADDAKQALFMRPSLDYYFNSLWYNDNIKFWEQLYSLLTSTEQTHVRLFARLIPFPVIVRECDDIELLKQLFDWLKGDPEIGKEATRRLLQCIRIIKPDNNKLWVEFYDRLLNYLLPEYLWDLSCLVSDVIKSKADDTFERAAKIARGILQRVWENEDNKEYNAIVNVKAVGSSLLIPAVAQSFETDPIASKQLLEPVLNEILDPERHTDYVYRLCDNIRYIYEADPEFACQIYLKVFGYEENDRTEIPMREGVLSMSTNRRDEYRMCWYVLKENIAGFLESNLEYAVKAISQSIEANVLYRHTKGYLDDSENISWDDIAESFDVDGQKAMYCPDYSHSWEAYDLHEEEPEELVSIILAHLRKSLENGEMAEIQNAFKYTVRYARLAMIWRRVLMLGIEFPKSMAPLLYSLCFAPPILCNRETIYEITEFIAKAFTIYNEEQQHQIVDAIMALDHKNPALLLSIQRRLLSTINNVGALNNKEASQLLAETPEEEQYQFRNEPQFSFSIESRNDVDWFDEVVCARSGIKPEDEIAVQIKKISRELQEIILNPKEENLDDGKKAFHIIKRSIDTLDQLEKSVDDIQVYRDALGYAWDYAAQKIHDLIWCYKNQTHTEIFKYCRTILIRCVAHWRPIAQEDANENFKTACWSPCPRNIAAQTLPAIIAIKKEHDDEVWKSILTLMTDAEPSVRYLVLLEFWRVIEVYEDDFWQVMTTQSESEQNVVCKEALFFSVRRSINKDTLEKVEHIYNNLCCEPSLELENMTNYSFQKSIFDIWINENDEWSVDKINGWLADPNQYATPLNSAVYRAMEYLAPPFTHRDAKVLDRGVEFLKQALECVSECIDKFDAADNEDKEVLKEKYRKLFNVIDAVASRAFFDAGTFKSNKRVISSSDKRLYFSRMQPLFSIMAEISEKYGWLHPSTTNHIIEYLQNMLFVDPAECLSLALRIVKGSSAMGYHMDPLGIKEAVKLVEMLLTDHKQVLQNPDSLNDMLNFLDIFSDVGSDEAVKLVWRLEEVFR